MGTIRKDAKDLLIGNDGSEKEPEDFGTELQTSIKSGIISKADGTLLITARSNSDKLGEKIDKTQLDAVRKLRDIEVYNSVEEEREAIRKKEAKKKEEERKRKAREAKVANEMNKIPKKQTHKENEKSQKEREN